MLSLILSVGLFTHNKGAPSGGQPNTAIPQQDTSTSAALQQTQPIYPNPTLTPGAINQDITQDNISQNICNKSWSTKSIRPPVSYTNKLKIEQIKEYGYKDTNVADYEEDHFIPLEIGGNPTSSDNLWPEPYLSPDQQGGAKQKDKVENFLHQQICSGAMTLKQAQSAIVNDWYAVYQTL